MSIPSGSVPLGAAVAAVVIAVGAGLFVLGSPAEERVRRLDERRVADLRAIVAGTNLYWTRHGRLPESLAELASEPGVRITTADPESSEAYRYRRLQDDRYEVCAIFARETPFPTTSPATSVWAHGSGPQCFEFEPDAIARNDSGLILAPESRDEVARPSR